MESLWADALYLAALTLIITVVGVMTYVFNKFTIGENEI